MHTTQIMLSVRKAAWSLGHYGLHFLLHRSKLTIAEGIHVRAGKMAQELSLAFSMDHFHRPSTYVDWSTATCNLDSRGLDSFF